jgi:F0F1-type ATP synthase membrane subunit a
VLAGILALVVVLFVLVMVLLRQRQQPSSKVSAALEQMLKLARDDLDELYGQTGTRDEAMVILSK